MVCTESGWRVWGVPPGDKARLGGGEDQDQVRFHPECWVKMGEAWLESGQAPTETRGRKALVLSREQKAKRLRLLHRYASNRLRLRRVLEKMGAEPGEPSLGWLAMQMRVAELVMMKEIEPLGGVPKSWVERSILKAEPV